MMWLSSLDLFKPFSFVFFHQLNLSIFPTWFVLSIRGEIKRSAAFLAQTKVTHGCVPDLCRKFCPLWPESPNLFVFLCCARSCPTRCSPMDCSLPSSSAQNFTGVECHFPFQGIFPTQGWNLHLLYLLLRQAETLPPAPPEKPIGFPEAWRLSIGREELAAEPRRECSVAPLVLLLT